MLAKTETLNVQFRRPTPSFECLKPAHVGHAPKGAPLGDSRCRHAIDLNTEAMFLRET